MQSIKESENNNMKRQLEEAVNLLDRIEPLINDSDIKNQIKEYISNYVNEDNETEIIDSYHIVTAPPYSSQLWFKETNEEYIIVIYQTSLVGNYSSEIRFDKNKSGIIKNFIKYVNGKLNENLNWLSLLETAIADNMKVLDNNTIYAITSDGQKLTAENIIEMIGNNDPIVYDWYRDIIGTAIRAIQIKSNK